MMTQMSSLALSGKMKPVMRTSRLYRFVVLLSALGCVFSFAGTGFSQPARGEDKDRSRELSREQEQIRAIVLKLADDMDKVAEKLEASEPQDAERLRAGARQIRTQRLPDTLAQIEGMLSNKDFISAVSRQNEAIKIIDDILAVLEASQFTESRAGQQLEKLKEQRKLTGKLKQEQERLLDETRKFLSEKEAAEGLQDLTDLISEVLKMQEGLVKGDSTGKIDPEGGGKDREALDEAIEAARDLQGLQKRVNDGLARLPRGEEREKDQREIADARKAIENLDELIRQARALARDSGQLDRKSTELGRMSAANRPVSPGKPAGEQPRPADEGARNKGEPSKGEASQGKPDQGEQGKGEQAEGAEGKKEQGGENSAEGQPGRKSPEAGKSEAGKPGEKPQQGAKDETSGKETAPELQKGTSELELARAAQEISDLKAELESRAGQFQEGLRKAGGKLEEETLPEAAREGVSAAEGKSRQADEAIKRDDFKAAEQGQEGAAQELERAREEVAKQLKEAMARNALQTAGLGQEEQRLSRKASSASSQAGEQAQRSESQAARDALQRGSSLFKKASEAMRQARESLSEAQQGQAEKSGREASAALEQAKKELEQAKKDLAGRSELQKKQDLEKKLARKTKDAASETSRLERKLRRKDEQKPGGLRQAGQSLEEAARKMTESSEASRQGRQELSRKRQEEALDQLKKAKEQVEEKKKEQLAKLERRKRFDRQSQEQKELARQTSDAAKQNKSSGQPQRSQQLQDASEKMEQAAENLDQGNPDEAEQNQEEALAKLQQQEEELREEEESLEELKREQELVSLVKELTETKDAQLEINTATAAVQRERPAGRLSRRRRASLQRMVEPLARQEGDLSDKVITLIGRLEEESSRVFTFMLKNVSADMQQVRDLLLELETDSFTQFLQKGVVVDIERMIASLEEQLEVMKRQRQQQEQQQQEQQQQQQPQQQNEALVSMLAELLMLKNLQLEINRQTGQLEDLRQSNDGSSDSGQWSRALDRLQQRQGNVGRLVVELAEDFRKAQEQSQGGPGGAEAPEGESSEETPGEDPEKAPGDGGDGDGDNGGGDDAEE